MSRGVQLLDNIRRYAWKALVSEKHGYKYDRNYTFPYRKGKGTPLFGWLPFRLSGIGDPVGFVVDTSAFTAQRLVIPGKL